MESISDGTDNSELIGEIDKYFEHQYKPNNFFGQNSIEISYDKSFECSCMLISKQLNFSSPKSMTVLQFYNAMEMIRKEAEALQKAYKR